MRLPVISTRNDRFRGAFSLVELLLAIGIIAILVTVSFVGFGSLTERARGVKCLANLKSLGLGFQRYAFDYQGYLPIRQRPVNSSTPHQWHREVWPAYRSASDPVDWGQARGVAQAGNYKDWTFHCPQDQDPLSTTPGLSYSGNTRLADTRIAQVTAQHILLIEVKNNYMANGSIAERVRYAKRHSGRLHILFGDYRVEALLPTEVPAFANHPEAWAVSP